MASRQGSFIIGVILVVVGLVLLADRADLFSFDWPVIVAVIGAALLVRAFIDKGDRGYFVGLLLLLIGLLFLGRHEGWLPWELSHGWPAFVLAVGLAFLGAHIFSGGREGSLIAGLVLVAIVIFSVYSDLHWRAWSRIEDSVGEVLEWWPLLLLGLGVYLLVRRR